MPQLADIAVYSPDHRLQLIVEVKGKTDAGPEWAAKMRRNLLVHSIIPSSPFFLLAAPDHFYLWRNGTGSAAEKLPDFVVDSRAIVDPYISNTSISPQRISDSSLELILTSWLTALVNSSLSPEGVAPTEKWLFDSGLYEAIKNGLVETEAST